LLCAKFAARVQFDVRGNTKSPIGDSGSAAPKFGSAGRSPTPSLAFPSERRSHGTCPRWKIDRGAKIRKPVGWTVAFTDGFPKFSITGGGGNSKLKVGRRKGKNGAQK
jgi:hypothetical protein